MVSSEWPAWEGAAGGNKRPRLMDMALSVTSAETYTMPGALPVRGRTVLPGEERGLAREIQGPPGSHVGVVTETELG